MASIALPTLLPKGFNTGTNMTNTIQSLRLTQSFLRNVSFLALVVCIAIGSVQQTTAATVNFSSIEVALADPDNKDDIMNALWTGWMNQVYEYNMPFIELANEATDTLSISEFRFSIGDTNYNFGNEFFRKEKTNASGIPVTGDYALLGESTPGIPFSSSIEDGGDTLVLSFGNGGLAPGQTVRFQVDINADDPADRDLMFFAPYTEVFFNNGDNADNSLVSLAFVGSDEEASAFIPNFEVPNAVSVTTPRPHSQMQMLDPLPGLQLTGNRIPEPGSLALLLIAGLGATAGQGRRNKKSVV